MGFPDMYFASFTGLLTTMPVLSSKPRMEKKPSKVENPNDLIKKQTNKTNQPFSSKKNFFERFSATYKMTLVDNLYGEKHGTLDHKSSL